MRKGLFIVFAGPEGMGKSTQATEMNRRLVEKGHQTLLTKEPGGEDEFSKCMREIILNPPSVIDGLTEFFLFEANRTHHVSKSIEPALQEGKIVLEDRFSETTFAIQVVAREALSKDDFQIIEKLSTRGIRPDCYFYYDGDPKIGIDRKKTQGEVTRFEKEPIEFHNKIRKGLLGFFNGMPHDMCKKFDGTRTKEELYEETWEALQEVISRKK